MEENWGLILFSREKLVVIFLPLLLLLLALFPGFSNLAVDRSVSLTLLLGFWMVLWWVFEVLPLGITALIPLFYLPFLGVVSINEVAPSYSNPVIFLFLGGFIIARAMEKTNLDERVALSILLKTGRTDQGIVVGFIVATAFLSMWISNTATTVMMVPIALSVTHFLKQNLSAEAQKSLPTLNTVLFLSIAYAANIGGIATPVGTPPNVVFMGYLNDLYGRSVDFYRWLMACAPIAILLLALMHFILRKIYPYHVDLPKNFMEFIRTKYNSLGKQGSSQKITVSVFLLAASMWIFKDVLHWVTGFNFLNDTSIALLCGVLLFLIPSAELNWKPVLDKSDIGKLPWDIVLLFGGGMALANALKKVGLIEKVTNAFANQPMDSIYLLIFVLAFCALFLTEIMSNVALCVVALPLIMKLGESQGIDPLLIALPSALCTSFAFSMPISTPPNAIVFGTEMVSVKQMLKAGILLNFVALLLTMTLGYWLIGLLLI